MTEKSQAPLFTRLIEHNKNEYQSFHVPGHKGGRVFSSQAKDWFFPLLQLDQTEVEGLDDLHDPQGVIEQAQRLAAKEFNAMHTFFLVNGTTVGNLAMIMATCQEGDVVLVQRNSHKSIHHALKLAKVYPVYLEPQFEQDIELTTSVPIRTVLKAIDKFPNAKALVLTNPTYYGITTNLTEMISVAHSNGIPVLVDEAHGAHYGIEGPFPSSAISQGADIVTQSAHKTLPAMTMGSYLHFNSRLVSIKKVAEYLEMLQSSSPSYPIMASLDLARQYRQDLTQEQVSSIYNATETFRNLLGEIPQFEVVSLTPESDDEIDPLKVTVRTKCYASAKKIQKLLEDKGIYTELASDIHILFVLPLSVIDYTEVVERIRQTVESLPPINRVEKMSWQHSNDISDLALTYKEMKQYKQRKEHIDKIEGKIAAENVIPYPPGIPLIVEGEKVTATMVKQIKRLLSAGVSFQGHTKLEHLSIYDTDVERGNS
ncbi:aminotransferase class I/II-fold pyridoxal phosphate-dependent enzyme [Bacillus alkalicellulosilyticus]|uniref:aminotransferase class I/II-fold pyridoxal phosphate-dependent enzyme n=1 Tax=Alkalihalobacterium alkalicellulosilyticum TaxID=1912214 RepID=UPI0009967AED|nr:aminotransferase class I/II-fold pyridoxal phosphate-dependent enzyme [Bacillus alkalicellulosilyticus]